MVTAQATCQIDRFLSTFAVSVQIKAKTAEKNIKRDSSKYKLLPGHKR